MDYPKGQSLVFSKDASDSSASKENPPDAFLKEEAEDLNLDSSLPEKQEESSSDLVATSGKPLSFKYPKTKSQTIKEEKPDSQENLPDESVSLSDVGEKPIVLDISGKTEGEVFQDSQETEEPEARSREFPVLKVSEDIENKSSQTPEPVVQNLASQESSLTEVLKEPVEDAVQDSPKNDFESTYESKKSDSQEKQDEIKTDLSGLSSSAEGGPEFISNEEDFTEERGDEKLGPKPMVGIEATQLPEKEDGKPELDSQASPVEPPVTPSFVADKKPSGLKKILPIVLILLLASLIGFSIFKFVLPKIEKKGKVELIYWGLWESEGVMNQIIADFNREYPEVKVKYTMQSKQEYRERLQSSLARDEGPDIFRFHIAWTPMLKNQLDKVPEDVFSASQYQSTFYPVAASQLRSGSGYLGIPLEVDTLALFYNKEIFQMAGKTPPKTWEELRSAAIDLTVRDASGRIQTAGVALGNTTNIEHWSDILGLMMVQNGVDLNMVSKCSTFESEEVCLGVDALRFYTLFNKVDQVWNSSMPNSTESFASGKLAMYFGYSWDVFEIQARNKNLNFGVVEAPQLSGEKISWASFWVEGVNNKSGFKEEAWQFMKFLSKKETLEKLYSLSSNTRAFGEPYPRVDMKAMLSSNPLVFPFVNQASYAQTWYLCSRTYDNGINDKMIDYFKDAVNAVNLNKDPKQALETASMGVSQLLSQYGLGSYTVR